MFFEPISAEAKILYGILLDRMSLSQRNGWLDELQKDFIEKFVAFAYEDICKDIFAKLCKEGAVAFTSSRIGSYWLNDFDGDHILR